MNFGFAMAIVCLLGVIAEAAGPTNETIAAITEAPTEAPTKASTKAPAPETTKTPASTKPPTQPPVTTKAPTAPTSTPTEGPKPTEAPKPMKGPFTFKLQDNNNKTCAILKIAARINTEAESWDVPADASVSGKCDNQVELTSGDKILKIIFKKTDSDKKWEISEFKVNIGKGGDIVFQDNATATYKASVEDSFSCNARHSMKSGEAELIVEDLKFQPFINGKDDFTGRVVHCDADKAANNVVPIAVGAALALLVIIVLILYLIGRRKHQKGYQTV